jgi:hypothetical protein
MLGVLRASAVKNESSVATNTEEGDHPVIEV